MTHRVSNSTRGFRSPTSLVGLAWVGMIGGLASVANANHTVPLNRTRQVQVVDVDTNMEWKTILSWFGGASLLVMVTGGFFVLLAKYGFGVKIGKDAQGRWRVTTT